MEAGDCIGVSFVRAILRGSVGMCSVGSREERGGFFGGKVEAFSEDGFVAEGFEAVGGSVEAARSSSSMSRLFRKSHASSTFSGVCRLITPTVRCIAPTGRTALGGILECPFSSGLVVSVAKREREACSSGLDTVVTRGRQRKCVICGFGGMVGTMGSLILAKFSISAILCRQGVISTSILAVSSTTNQASLTPACLFFLDVAPIALFNPVA